MNSHKNVKFENTTRKEKNFIRESLLSMIAMDIVHLARILSEYDDKCTDKIKFFYL